MVKKKTVSSGTKKSTVKSVTKSKSSHAPKIRWYVWVLIGLILVILCNLAYKNVATRRDVALLDKAEAKMRQLDFPGGKEGEIERYCSEKSVKFGSPGKPSCGVSITSTPPASNTIGNSNTESTIRSISMSGADVEQYRNDKDRAYYNITGYVDGLKCYMGDVLVKDYTSNVTIQDLTLYCQKEFQTKVYPIRN
ncbi:hypothetical protein H6800_01130 [Candidatus Nomurabacteria bacterium]|nr:hypothetical protein [Candidatus Nomurabacteria bacterium]